MVSCEAHLGSTGVAIDLEGYSLHLTHADASQYEAQMRRVSGSVAGGGTTHSTHVLSWRQENMGGRKHLTHAVTCQLVGPRRRHADEVVVPEEEQNLCQVCFHDLGRFVMALVMALESHIREL